jgi:hypothetical protein
LKKKLKIEFKKQRKKQSLALTQNQKKVFGRETAVKRSQTRKTNCVVLRCDSRSARQKTGH